MIDPGAVFNGLVVANSLVNDVLQLSDTTASGNAGTLVGLGSEYTGYATLLGSAGAAWTIDTSVAVLSQIGTVTLVATDTLSLAGGGDIARTYTGLGALDLTGGAFTFLDLASPDRVTGWAAAATPSSRRCDGASLPRTDCASHSVAA